MRVEATAFRYKTGESKSIKGKAKEQKGSELTIDTRHRSVRG